MFITLDLKGKHKKETDNRIRINITEIAGFKFNKRLDCYSIRMGYGETYHVKEDFDQITCRINVAQRIMQGLPAIDQVYQRTYKTMNPTFPFDQIERVDL